MNVQSEINHLSGTQKEFSIEASAEKVQQEFDRAYTVMSRTAKVAGFRPGKVPRSIIKQKFQPEVREAVVNQLLPELIRAALEEHNLRIVTDPKINDLSLEEGQPLKLKATVEVFPQFEVTGYKGLQVKKKVTAVTSKDVDDELEELRENHAELLPVEDRPSQVGDVVAVALSARPIVAEGEAEADWLKEERTELEIGDKNVLPEFNENLPGLQVGEAKHFRVAYPADYGSAALAGREFEYQARLEGLYIKERPELDDEFPKTIGEESATLAEFRQVLESRLQQENEAEADRSISDVVLHQLMEAHQIDVPETIVRRQLEGQLQNIARSAIRQGIDPRSAEIDWEAIARQEREQAIRSVRVVFLLQRIADQESITISNTELDAEINHLAAQRRESPLQLKGRLTKDGSLDTMRTEMRNRKALEFIVQAATVEREVVDGEA